MTSFERFERSLPILFDELATPRVPDYFDDLLARTAATRQRSDWAFPERWIPMYAITRRLPATPRIPWRLGAAVALLAVAAVVAALAAGALFNQSIATGPGRNGEIIFVDQSGAVVAGDPLTGRTRTLVATSPSANTKPIFSPDGSKFLILRPSAAGSQDIYVVDLFGNETRITPSALTAWHYIGWSPRSDRVLIRDDGGRILLLDATKAAEPVSLSRNIGMGDLWIGNGFNYRSSNAFRPPAGDEVLFTANDGHTLATIRQDGTGLRTIFDLPARVGVWLEDPQWSPDGRQIAFEIQTTVTGPLTTFVINADGSNLRQVSDVGHQEGPMWSPDGTRLAIEYWTPGATAEDDWVPHPIAILDVASGELHEVGPVARDGYLSFEWSPDGKSILEVPRDGFGKILIVDSTTGETTTTPWAVDQPISWQRLPAD
jgi:Tol biopolymer transport system component